MFGLIKHNCCNLISQLPTHVVAIAARLYREIVEDSLNCCGKESKELERVIK